MLCPSASEAQTVFLGQDGVSLDAAPLVHLLGAALRIPVGVHSPPFFKHPAFVHRRSHSRLGVEWLDAAAALAKHLLPGGVIVFQERDATMVRTSLDAFIRHRKAQQR